MTSEQISNFGLITMVVMLLGILGTWVYLATQLFWIGFKKRFTI